MQEIVTLHSPGALPGIPGESHGPGVFLVDWDARTITEIPSSGQEDVQPADIPPAQNAPTPEQPAEAEAPLEQPATPQSDAPTPEQATEPTPTEGGVS